MELYENLRDIWLEKTKEATSRVTMLSPYITGTLACDLALEARHGMRIYTLFDFSIFASRSSHLDIIEELIDKPKCTVYRLRNLHAKVLMDEHRFASVGSQNVTWRGSLRSSGDAVPSGNLELSARLEKAASNRAVRAIVEPWLDDGTPITHSMINEMRVGLEEWTEKYAELQKLLAARQKEIDDNERLLGRKGINAGIEKQIKKGTRLHSPLFGMVKKLRQGASITLKVEPGGDLLNWPKKNRKPTTFEGRSRLLCVVNSKELGWARMNKGQITFITRSIVTAPGLIPAFPELNLWLSTDRKDIDSVKRTCNLVAFLEYDNSVVCSIPMKYDLDTLVMLPVSKAQGLQKDGAPSPVKVARWVRENAETFKDLVTKEVIEEFTIEKGYKLDGITADAFFGAIGTRWKIELVEIAKKYVLSVSTHAA